MFNKKFKVRVKYYFQNYYVVQYAYYYVLPIYKNINFWFQQSLTSSTACWSVNLFDCESAEKLAKTFNSIEDVNKYYESDMAKMKKFYIDREKDKEINQPYKVKYFK